VIINFIFLDIEKIVFQKHMLKVQSVFNISSKIWTDDLYCMMCPRHFQKWKTRSILCPWIFQHWKLYKWNNDDICCIPTYRVGYFIWYKWPAIFFEFDRPEMCEGCAVEW